VEDLSSDIIARALTRGLKISLHGPLTGIGAITKLLTGVSSRYFLMRTLGDGELWANRSARTPRYMSETDIGKIRGEQKVERVWKLGRGYLQQVWGAYGFVRGGEREDKWASWTAEKEMCVLWPSFNIHPIELRILSVALLGLKMLGVLLLPTKA
jgi:hypothetical protein